MFLSKAEVRPLSGTCQPRTMLRPDYWRAMAYGFWNREQSGTLRRVDQRAMAGSHPWSNRKFASMTALPTSR